MYKFLLTNAIHHVKHALTLKLVILVLIKALKLQLAQILTLIDVNVILVDISTTIYVFHPVLMAIGQI